MLKSTPAWKVHHRRLRLIWAMVRMEWWSSPTSRAWRSTDQSGAQSKTKSSLWWGWDYDNRSLCQVRRSPRSRLGTRTRSSGSQKRRQSSRRLWAWSPILEWPKISSFSLVGSFFVRFADIDDNFQLKVMAWVCQQWQLPGYSRGNKINSIKYHPKGSLIAYSILGLLPLSGKKRGMMVIGQSWPGRRFHMSV